MVTPAAMAVAMVEEARGEAVMGEAVMVADMEATVAMEV